MSLDLSALLQPIPGDDPCGEDVSFDDCYDKIREARRADDPNLPQGDWQSELKVADWHQVVELSSQVLSRRSKDLQIAAWLAEGLVCRHGFEAAAPALELLRRLIDDYWPGLYPRLGKEGIEERIARLEWLDNYLGQALQRAPLSRDKPVMSLLDWQTSREVDNLARHNHAGWQAAIDEGKPDVERFDRALQDSGGEFIGALRASLAEANTACQALQATLEQLLGRQAPTLRNIHDQLQHASQVIAQAAAQLGLGGSPASEPDAPAMTETLVADSIGNAASIPQRTPLEAMPQETRQEALRQIRQIAVWFRRNEPHSPVAYLLERAVLWADMPLDQWLAEVVDDSSVLSRVRERIGAPSE
ncbi:type VI secretion system protein TssA [Azotobacter chroococcum]|uniref:type VI secretion system protein TssA n=1 Tax=Azotobacter chroococcum TaxID=353 RepID=UPI0010ADCE45|nr:type VI secretion system protein TssA [Azotobacter chroococcum]TKD29909.1 type VI secretion system protein TssA [Azotobacter chroococcum]